jgi:hypothetical protein
MMPVIRSTATNKPASDQTVVINGARGLVVFGGLMDAVTRPTGASAGVAELDLGNTGKGVVSDARSRLGDSTPCGARSVR